VSVRLLRGLSVLSQKKQPERERSGPDTARHQRGDAGYSGQWGGGETGLTPLLISPRQRLDAVIKAASALRLGGTSFRLPMVWTLKSKVEADVFVAYTDLETWAGSIQPVQALRLYRERLGIPAKLIVCGMVSNGFTLADPGDTGMMDVVGFSTAAPNVVSDFAVA